MVYPVSAQEPEWQVSVENFGAKRNGGGVNVRDRFLAARERVQGLVNSRLRRLFGRLCGRILSAANHEDRGDMQETYSDDILSIEGRSGSTSLVTISAFLVKHSLR